MKLIITDIENFAPQVEGEYELYTPKNPAKECIGCFGCWTRTPGRCIIRDGYDMTGKILARCDELIIISECCYGSYSPFVKTVIDRALGYVHPNFEIRNEQMHHKSRYENTLSFSAYFYGTDITEKEKSTADKFVRAEALNYNGNVKEIKFLGSTVEAEEIVL